MASFSHPSYMLSDDGRIVRKTGQKSKSLETNEEAASVIEALTDYVQGRMGECGLVEHWIPDAEDDARCNIFLTPLDKATKLLVILQNQVGSKPGVWSRSLCLSQGLKAGSMMECIERGLRLGYAVAILNPNTNSVTVGGERMPIANSFSPENHVLHVWDTYIAPASNIRSIFLLTYGNGSSLAVDIVQRQIVRCEENPGEEMRIRAIAAIEPSLVLEESEENDAATKGALKAVTLAFEGNREFPYPVRLASAEEKLGVSCVSVGLDQNSDEPNAAASIGLAMDHVLRFFHFAETQRAPVVEAFIAKEGSRLQLDPSQGLPTTKKASPAANAAPKSDDGGGPEVASSGTQQPSSGLFARVFGGSSKGKRPGIEQHVVSNSLTVSDFDLLRVVGKGAFGKVMLVRKKANQDAGRIFAMKVLKKSVIAAKGQTEHTRSERAILCEIRHPYIVRLRYAFQSDEKLYLVTDYYNGGSLFYHLRKSRGFPEPRARFYGAELVLALDHLHSNGVIYRDLKLENILMDHLGHIALTDFGLSKENITDVFSSQLTTFCGTAEYIAPELLKGQKYGASVDWWSFGILLYEMMGFRTPFYEKNRKLMFHGIINCEPTFPPHFAHGAKTVLRDLLRKDPSDRLGSKGVAEIKDSEFFRVIDFNLLARKDLEPPFKPDVVDESDTKYVPKTYLQAKPEDSVDTSAKKQQQSDFAGFTFIPDS